MKKIIALIGSYTVFISIIAYGIILDSPVTWIFFPEKKLCFEFGDWFCRFGSFDGVHYSEIALRGYQSLEHSFLPLYPILIHIYSTIFHSSVVLVARALSLIFAVLGIFGLHIYSKKNIGLKNLQQLPFLVLSFPTAFYLVSAYNDSLFFALVVVYMLCKPEKLLFKSLIVSAMLLTRFNGVALLVFFLWEVIRAPKINYLKKFGLILIPFLSIGAYLLYCQIFFGSFRAPLQSMSLWGRGVFTFPLITTLRYFNILYHNSFADWTTWIALFELLSFFLYLYLLWRLWQMGQKRLAVLASLILAIPSISGTFQGMGRYIYHAPMLFFALERQISLLHQKLRIAIYILLISMQFVFLWGFLMGYFVS